MAVRTLNVALGVTDAAADVLLFTVPVDRTLIVKDVVLHNHFGGTTFVSIYAVRSGDAVALAESEALAAGGALERRQMFTVIQAGDELHLYAAAAGVQYLVSGALLQGEAE